MIIKPFFSFILLVISFCPVLAQDSLKRCHTIEYHKHLYQKKPYLKKNADTFESLIAEKDAQKKRQTGFQQDATKIITIPVVVHVIHNNLNDVIGGRNNRNISEEQIFSQIQVLNEDYRKMQETPGYNEHPAGADTRLEFCLASRDPQNNPTNGIVRVYDSRHSFSLRDTETISSLSYWPSDRYLNIWVTNLSGNILGFAQFPHGSGLPGLGSIDEGASTDGVFINWRQFGVGGTTNPPYNQGRTTTHEVGHWLGLRHIWGDSFCGNDYVDDTPRHEEANYECPGFSDCDRTGVPSVDMTENFMDYTDDECMNMFTKGQSRRMRVVMENSPRRIALQFSPGCCKEGETTIAPYYTSFNDEIFSRDGWSEHNVAGDFNTRWEQASVGAGENSLNSLSIENREGSEGNINYFTSPFFDFQSITNPVMDFDLAYATNYTGQTDTLVLSYSPNCLDWFPVTTLYGNELISTPRITNDFSPQPNEWRRIRIPLNDLKNQQILQFRFENRSAGINNVYIDNLNIYRTSPTLTVNMYPNPASDRLFAEVVFTGDQDITFEVFNLMGKKLSEWTDTGKISYIKQIETFPLSQGMYIFRISSTQGDVVQKKVLIQR